MNSLQKILVVDNGDRESVDPLSVELAELGVSSVTTAFEATDDVLDVIDRPAAIFVKMPRASDSRAYRDVMDFADKLRLRESTLGVPVIVWDGQAGAAQGGISEILRRNVGADALSRPEL